ncbi:unnamed protein product [Pleuronectes platessa]|uniref:Uncharacterized protein n=1 Tax=Pleuronectes platessa TaxID=8262 RepID=A0A9N7U6N7_PLEPL|nr:unnamed protein product [Pleuronectes platessa]
MWEHSWGLLRQVLCAGGERRLRVSAVTQGSLSLSSSSFSMFRVVKHGGGLLTADCRTQQRSSSLQKLLLTLLHWRDGHKRQQIG